jgi:hypothetical protein
MAEPDTKIICGRLAALPLVVFVAWHMVSELAARHALPRDVIEGVTERTGGVPLFVDTSK